MDSFTLFIRQDDRPDNGPLAKGIQVEGVEFRVFKSTNAYDLGCPSLEIRGSDDVIRKSLDMLKTLIMSAQIVTFDPDKHDDLP